MSDTQNENGNHLGKAAREAAEREDMKERDPEPSLARRFGQIGVLGWMIVIPVLAAVILGGWLDRLFGTGITFAAAAIFAGAALGLWFAFRWMHEQ